MGSAAPAAARATRARHRRGPSRDLERDEGLRLRKLERAITMRLAKRAELEALAELSCFLDSVHAHERLDGLREVAL